MCHAYVDEGLGNYRSKITSASPVYIWQARILSNLFHGPAGPAPQRPQHDLLLSRHVDYATTHVLETGTFLVSVSIKYYKAELKTSCP